MLWIKNKKKEKEQKEKGLVKKTRIIKVNFISESENEKYDKGKR